MSRRARFLCIILFAVTLVLACRAFRALPVPRHELVEAKYAGWSGVLRLWVLEDMPCGALTGWLNACAASFERAHPGVYVQAEPIAADALRQLRTSGVNPPDLILFPPGLLPSGEGLFPIALDSAVAQTLREPLLSAGVWQGEVRAVPVAMGAYVWAYDRAQLPSLPENWADSDVSLVLPEDEDFRAWSAAVLALCSGQTTAADAPAELPGLDLGLPDAPTPSPTRAEPPAEAGEPCRLPADIRREEGIYSKFTSGELPVLPATQRELVRLSLLSARGRGPDWQTAMPGKYALADQLALLALVDAPRSHAQERRTLCEALLAHLLAPESQQALAKARAFSVRGDVAVYEGRAPLAQTESSLKNKELLVPSAFDTAWRGGAAALLDACADRRLTPRQALERMPGLFH